MSTRLNKILKGATSLTVGQVIINALSLARNVIIARILSPSDYGIAAIFTLTISFLEMLSNLSAETLLIQADFGEEENFQNTVHFIQVMRGFVLAFIIYFASPLVARLFDAQDALWAFKSLALVPIIRSFIHRDINRVQRSYNYIPSILTEAVSASLSTVMAIPLCLYFKNYWAALFVILIQSVTTTITSHVVSKRKYLIGLHREYLREIMRFGWPLIINAFFIFIVFNGDRLVIGSAKTMFNGVGYPLELLGYYSAAVSLTLAPVLMIGRITNSLLLPFYSEVKNHSEKLFNRYEYSVQIITVISMLFVIPFVLGGTKIVTIVFGDKYLAAGKVIGVLAVIQGLRLIRYVPTVAAISMGDTKNAMLTNIVRATALLGALISAFKGADIIWMALAGLIGEIFAIIFCVGRLKIVHNLKMQTVLMPLGLLMGIFAVAYGISIGTNWTQTITQLIAINMIVYLASCLFLMAVFKSLRLMLFKMVIAGFNRSY